MIHMNRSAFNPHKDLHGQCAPPGGRTGKSESLAAHPENELAYTARLSLSLSLSAPCGIERKMGRKAYACNSRGRARALAKRSAERARDRVTFWRCVMRVLNTSRVTDNGRSVSTLGLMNKKYIALAFTSPRVFCWQSSGDLAANAAISENGRR